MQRYVLLSQLMYQFLVFIYKCCKLFFPCNAVVSSIIRIPAPIKADDPLPPSLKMKPPPLKSKVSFQERFLEKKPQNSETVVNTCVSLTKKHWKKITEIPQKRDFLTWSIQKFVRKVKQFLRKCYIT